MIPIMEDFPSCCTAMILSQFGESEVAEGGYEEQNFKRLKSYIEHNLKAIRSQGFAMVCVTTNNEQKITNKVLLEIGFKHSAWMSKTNHPETKIRLWWYPLES